jgi:TetR/AcrR family transcriptional repressor of nem operon
MANSRPGGKRERLVAGATELLHRQGVHATTLADVAAAAGVPLGNVYYYYKTREDLVGAVIEQWKAALAEQLDHLQARRTPGARLKGLAELWTVQAETVAAHGCPLGGLSYELNKGHDALAAHAQDLVGTVLDWAEAQFRALGLRDARGLAVHLVSGIQGAALLANTFGDAPLLRAEVRRLDRWIDEVVAASATVKPRRPAG